MFDGGSMFDTSDSPAPEASNYFEELLSARQRSSNILSDLNRQQADMRAQVVAGGLKDPSKAAQQLDELYKAVEGFDVAAVEDPAAPGAWTFASDTAKGCRRRASGDTGISSMDGASPNFWFITPSHVTRRAVNA